MLSQRSELGQYQCNGALAAAGRTGQNPRQIAQEVLTAVQPRNIFADLAVSGAGFINMTLTDDFLAEHVVVLQFDPRLGYRVTDELPRMVLDFGGPNVAKPMHVGHLRSSIIGDALQRIFRFAGYDLVSDIHLGDWGTQMGQLIEEVRRRFPDLPYFKNEYTGPFP